MKKPETGDVFKYLIVPLLFLTVALLGGLRFAEGTNDARFIAPQLVSVILAAFVMLLFARGGMIEMGEYVSERLGLLDNATGAVRLLSVYFATAQVFNSVTPEGGLLNFCFNLFYFLIFWNNLFVVFNPARLMKSLAAVLGASFLLKYLVLADLFAPSESWAKYILQKLTETASLGTLSVEAFAPATGYVAFATLALYILGLYLIAPRADESEELLYTIFVERYRLTPRKRRRLLAALAETASLEEGGREERADEVIEAEVVESRDQ